MKVFMTGGTGFIGRAVTRELLRQSHSVTVLTRFPRKAQSLFPPSVHIEPWDGISLGSWANHIDGSDSVINLAGEPIARKRWSSRQKNLIFSSRIRMTQHMVSALRSAKKKPSVLVNASAVGYYGHVEDKEVTEDQPRGNDFLAHLCESWEQEARRAEEFGVRVVLMRTGIVLSRTGGALKKMLPPFYLFAGGPLGSGKQWFPWIHIEDEVAAFLFVMTTEISGPVNLAAPESATMSQFCALLGKTLHRPSWARVPAFFLRMAFGEMADTVLLSGQRSVPEKLLKSKFQFRFPKLSPALQDIFSSKQSSTGEQS